MLAFGISNKKLCNKLGTIISPMAFLHIGNLYKRDFNIFIFPINKPSESYVVFSLISLYKISFDKLNIISFIYFDNGIKSSEDKFSIKPDIQS